MLDVLLTIYNITIILTVVYSSYFLCISLIGVLRKNKVTFKDTKKVHKFAILIAARNEEAVIGNLIHSLKLQNYPDDKYDIYVIPNNCTDNTEKVAKKEKAKIIECNVPTKTKGDVLRIAFDKLKDKKDIDGYLIFDADNVVHPDFLKEMNKVLASGYRVAQGFRDAKNASDNWISGSYNVYYQMQNAFFYRARMGLNWNASINGTGFMIKKELIDEYGFETFTLTEDIEFTGQCDLRKERIVYVPNAITYDEYPTLFSASWKQRKRWSTGMMDCRRRYSGKLFVNFLKYRHFPSLDQALVYCGPAIQLINCLTIVMSYFFKFYPVPLEDPFSKVFLSGILSALFSASVTIFLEILALIYTKQKPSAMLSGVILFPLFMVTWIPINIICLFKRQKNWEEIKHTRSISIHERIR